MGMCSCNTVAYNTTFCGGSKNGICGLHIATHNSRWNSWHHNARFTNAQQKGHKCHRNPIINWWHLTQVPLFAFVLISQWLTASHAVASDNNQWHHSSDWLLSSISPTLKASDLIQRKYSVCCVVEVRKNEWNTLLIKRQCFNMKLFSHLFLVIRNFLK